MSRCCLSFCVEARCCGSLCSAEHAEHAWICVCARWKMTVCLADPDNTLRRKVVFFTQLKTFGSWRCSRRAPSSSWSPRSSRTERYFAERFIELAVETPAFSSIVFLRLLNAGDAFQYRFFLRKRFTFPIFNVASGCCTASRTNCAYRCI